MAYTTLADLKQYLGISSASDDALLSSLIAAAQELIDDLTGRTFEAVADTREANQVVGRTLFLRHDLLAITSITDADGNAIATADVSPLAGEWPTRVLIIDHGRWPIPVLITGQWGYSNVAPAAISHACIRLASWMYRQKDAQVFDAAGQYDVGRLTIAPAIPHDVEQMIAPYRVTGVSI